MDPAVVIGSTGLTGSFIVSNLVAAANAMAVHTISRRSPKTAAAAASQRLHAVVDADTGAWAAHLAAIRPAPQTVFSALGTTAAQAGGTANQWKIDHDLNIELARAAKAAGARTFVFMSSAGVDGLLTRHLPYSQMKRGVEDAIRDLGFDNTVVVRLMLILGEREQGRFSEGLAQGLARSLPGRLADLWSHDAEIGARAAIRAAEIAGAGGAPSKHWVIEGSEIFRLGRDEWKKESDGTGEGTASS
ncbi:Protein fmp-52 [Escovopsis weberi]|uniref:Protein fmp-52 n=1 Tax=Escovopsis weberi TaxID=150374 RepID=A0A0M8MQK4_ESCWE|nr:Protein fmp-52 [Escovopsis weberi]